MQNISNEDLGSVIGGADSGAGAVCTKPSDSKPPQQFFENSHAGPSANDRIKDATNTMTSRGSSMLGDGRPSMPSEW